MNIDTSQREMTNRMASLLPENKKQLTGTMIPRREPFEILYRLNCDNLCADFHEDLEFRFSWGITALINRFAGKQSNKIAIANYPQDVSEIVKFYKHFITGDIKYSELILTGGIIISDTTIDSIANGQRGFGKICNERYRFSGAERRLVSRNEDRCSFDYVAGYHGWTHRRRICEYLNSESLNIFIST